MKKTIEVHYPDRQFHWLISARRECQITWTDRLAYSVLRQHRAGLTQKELAEMSGLAECGTVARSRDRLTAHGLIRVEDGRLYAESPEDKRDWFSISKRNGTLTCWRCLVPSAEAPHQLTQKTAAVLSMLYSLASYTARVERATLAGLGAMTGMDRATVDGSLEWLENLHLARIMRTKTAVIVGLPTPCKAAVDWFRPAPIDPEKAAFMASLDQLDADLEARRDALDQQDQTESKIQNDTPITPAVTPTPTPTPAVTDHPAAEVDDLLAMIMDWQPPEEYEWPEDN